MSFLSRGLVASLVLTVGVSADDWPKRGLAANDGVPIWQFGGEWEGHGSQINWQYNWDSTTDQKQDFAEFVPMLWGTQDYHTEEWSENADYWLSEGGSGHLLAFNEPDHPGQANMSPGDAVNAWREHMEPFADRADLGAPAVTNGGYDWLSQFLNECSGCNIDFIPVHWYNDPSQEEDFENWVNSICDLAGGRQVWITEFQALGSIDQQSDFLRSAIPFLDNNSCVYRYAYFGTADNSKVLLQDDGPSLSPLGVQYTFSPFGSGDGPN